MPKRALEETEQVEVANRAELRTWLAQHHTRTEGVWLVLWKKPAAPEKYIPVRDVTAELLCFGWIDSLPRKLDDTRSMLYIAPRRPQSNWSRVNKELVAKLDAAGQMMPAGLAKIEQAKADGSWTALDDVENLVIPTDLQAAFENFPDALANWHEFPRWAKRGMLEWLLNAKRPETRKKRIAAISESAQAGEMANQGR